VAVLPKKASSEIKIRIIRDKQKNGDIYVYERKTLYDPTKKYNKVLSSNLLHKIPKDTLAPVPTRPKRAPFDKILENAGQLTASRKHTGMMDVISYIGKSSGIDDGIYANTDIGTAKKIISLAQYLLATNGQTLPGILTWQFNHPIPYEEGITEDIYHDLFVQIGRDESLQQNFFASRAADITDRAVLAYDSTSLSTYSCNQIEARYGYNKAGDGLKIIKQLTLYSIETRQPIAFTKQPGNLPDVITVENALKQLSVIGLGNAEIITDNGYYSESNLSALFLASFDFITLVKTNIKWIKAELISHIDVFGKMSNICPFDAETHGITVMLMREFEKVRKYAGLKYGLKKGDKETFRRRVYLHLYYNPKRKAEEQAHFDRDLIELKKNIETGINIDDLPETVQNNVRKYLHMHRRNGKAFVSFNEAACEEAKKHFGYFALVSNGEKDTFECLRKYRKRETIESYFETMKQRVDGTRVRVWDTDTLRGRMFVQFVSLCYYEYISNEIRNLKKDLGVKNGNTGHDKAANLNLEKKLKSWLDNSPIYIVLQWFDTVESVTVSSKLYTKRWTTEITQRDKMFLDKIGIASLT
jgi:transposase